MFPMLVKSTAAGRTYEYIHLCESVWRKGRSSRRTVVSLGRKTCSPFTWTASTHSAAATGFPLPKTPLRSTVSAWVPSWSCAGSGPSSPCLNCSVPSPTGLWCWLPTASPSPASEHGLADWLRTYWVCDSQGRRFAPAFLSEAERTAAPNPRVKVKAFQLQKWYRTLDALLRLKSRIEGHLFRCFRHLFAPVRPGLR